jgi:chaperonin GroES
MIVIRPLDNRVVVRPLVQDGEKKTSGGLIIPSSVNPERIQVDGEIVTVGPGMRLADGTCARMQLKVGMRVIFGQYAGAEIVIDGVKHYVIRESDVLAVVEETEKAVELEETHPLGGVQNPT